eukprot:6194326-Pleurochrysis_carterae.AAC.1
MSSRLRVRACICLHLPMSLAACVQSAPLVASVFTRARPAAASRTALRWTGLLDGFSHSR